MIGAFMNGTPRQVRKAMAVMPDAQQLAVKSIVDRAAELSGTATAPLIQMFMHTVRAVYAASDESEQRTALLEVSAIGLALSNRLGN